MALPKWEVIKDQFGIHFDDFVLVTIHPESVEAYRNAELVEITRQALEDMVKINNILITKYNN